MVYKFKNNHSIKHRSALIIAVVILALLLGGVYYFLRVRNNSPTSGNPSSANNQDINYNPPTKAEQNETEQFKKDLSNNSSGSVQPTQTQNVTPVIGYLQQSADGNIESNGYIPGATETDGTCTLVLEKNGIKVSESRQTMIDAQGIICGRIVINRGKLSAGSWNAYIFYDSSKQKGNSASQSIDIK